MQDGYENSKNTVGFSTCLPMRETAVCVIAAGWPMMFTTYMGGAGRLAIGGSITAAFDVFAEDVTHLGTEKIDDGELWDHYYSWEERIEDDG